MLCTFFYKIHSSYPWKTLIYNDFPYPLQLLFMHPILRKHHSAIFQINVNRCLFSKFVINPRDGLITNVLITQADPLGLPLNPSSPLSPITRSQQFCLGNALVLVLSDLDSKTLFCFRWNPLIYNVTISSCLNKASPLITSFPVSATFISQNSCPKSQTQNSDIALQSEVLPRGPYTVHGGVVPLCSVFVPTCT